MDVLDTNVINTAITAMSKSLHVNPVDLKIALISYLLSLAVFIPISGWTADKHGIKHVFIAAMGLFTICSFYQLFQHKLSKENAISNDVPPLASEFFITYQRVTKNSRKRRARSRLRWWNFVVYRDHMFIMFSQREIGTLEWLQG